MAKPLSHLSPCTDILVVNGAVVKGEGSKFFKIAKKRVRKGKNGGNTQKIEIVLNGYLKFTREMMRFRMQNRLTPEALEVLVYTYCAFKESGSGVTSYSVCRSFSDLPALGNTLASCRNKMNTLVRRGMLAKLGFSARGAHLYIPSIKAIECLESIIK